MSREGLRARLADATPGPWHAGGAGAVCSDHVEEQVCWPVASTTTTNALAIADLSVHAPALLEVADAADALLRGDDALAVAEGRLRAALAALEALP